MEIRTVDWRKRTGNGITIVTIDSGASYHSSFPTSPKGVHLVCKNGQYCVDDNIIDNVGHGTAVYGIISKKYQMLLLLI